MTNEELLERFRLKNKHIRRLERALIEIVLLDGPQTLSEARDLAYRALGGSR